MGWRAITKDGEMLSEETHGRPVQAGEDGNLAVIAQEDYGHRIAIDLINGIIAFEYDRIGVQNGTVELDNPKYFMWICDDTVLLSDVFPTEHILHPSKEGEIVHSTIQHRLQWRPIWFSRVTNGIPTKIIGAQTTVPRPYERKSTSTHPRASKKLPKTGSRNVKKMIMLFPDGRVGIY